MVCPQAGLIFISSTVIFHDACLSIVSSPSFHNFIIDELSLTLMQTLSHSAKRTHKCLAIEPPKCGPSDIFLEVDKSKCRLLVPNESVDKYRAAEGWKDFKHISATEDMGEEG